MYCKFWKHCVCGIIDSVWKLEFLPPVSLHSHGRKNICRRAFVVIYDAVRPQSTFNVVTTYVIYHLVYHIERKIETPCSNLKVQTAQYLSSLSKPSSEISRIEFCALSFLLSRQCPAWVSIKFSPSSLRTKFLGQCWKNQKDDLPVGDAVS